MAATLQVDTSLSTTVTFLTRILQIAPVLKNIGYIVTVEESSGQSKLITRMQTYTGNKTIVTHLNSIITANENKRVIKPSTPGTPVKNYPVTQSFSGNDESLSADDMNINNMTPGNNTNPPRPANNSNKSSNQPKPPPNEKKDLTTNELDDFINNNFGPATTSNGLAD